MCKKTIKISTVFSAFPRGNPVHLPITRGETEKAALPKTGKTAPLILFLLTTVTPCEPASWEPSGWSWYASSVPRIRQSARALRRSDGYHPKFRAAAAAYMHHAVRGFPQSGLPPLQGTDTMSVRQSSPPSHVRGCPVRYAFRKRSARTGRVHKWCHCGES